LYLVKWIDNIMKSYNKQKQVIYFFSDGRSIVKTKNYLAPFTKIEFIKNDFNLFKKFNKNKNRIKSSYRNNFF